MKVRTTVLVENRALHSLGREHGLSLLVESETSCILFDTGASSLLLKNAKALGLEERLKRLDGVVISHGHYDHAGGLKAVLEMQERCVPLHAGPGLFERKVKRKGSKLRSIGVPFEREELDKAKRIEEASPREIRPGFFITGEIPIHEKWEEGTEELCIRKEGGEIIPDPFLEERALAVYTETGLLVFSGCAHRGLVNSIRAAQAAAAAEKVRAVFGGAHLRSASAERIRRTVEWVARLEPEWVALGHCTGSEAEEAFAKEFKDRFQSLKGGMEWDFA